MGYSNPKYDLGLKEVHEAIVQCHRNGGCDSDGNSAFVNDCTGRRICVSPKSAAAYVGNGRRSNFFVVPFGKEKFNNGFVDG